MNPAPNYVRVRAREVVINVRDAGAPDAPAVVLMHGVTATHDYVLMRATQLERSGFRVIAYDARGHGDSTAPARPDAYGYVELLDDLLAVIDDRGVSSALLVGASLGCHTALRCALDHPGRVTGVVAVTPAYDPERHPNRDAVRRAARLAGALRSGGADAFVDAYEFPDATPTRQAAFAEAMRRQLRRHAHPEAVADALEHAMGARPFGDLGELRGIRVPVLVAATRDELDSQHPLALAHRYAEVLGGADVVCEAEGRTPLAWNGAALARHVADFAAGIEL